MSSQLPPSARPSTLPLGFALAALSILLVAGGLIVWAHQDPSPALTAGPGQVPPMPPVSETVEVSVEGPVLPSRLRVPDGVGPNGAQPVVGFHSITLTKENGIRVVKIQVVAGGDEIVVDAASGRVLETRPTRSAATPVGKVMAPAPTVL